jgi:hypothetical protein
MIAECRHYHRPYWRYRADHPPAGFCSVPHRAKGATRKSIAPPRAPAELIRIMREHRALRHWEPNASRHREANASSWPDCETCDQMEAEYAAALSYHI